LLLVVAANFYTLEAHTRSIFGQARRTRIAIGLALLMGGFFRTGFWESSG
jgi:hypothetical protein